MAERTRWIADDDRDQWVMVDPDGNRVAFMHYEYALGMPNRGVHILNTQIGAAHRYDKHLEESRG